MKKFYFVLLICFTFSSSIYSQLPNGSLAPDFNLRDMNGNFHHLYDVLDSGKTVILDMFYVWCAPCWAYLQSQKLKKAYTAWGPSGTDQLRIFMVETIGSADSAIHGLGPDTKGDWTLNNPIPIIYTHSPNNFDFYTYYAATYAPMFYLICKNKRTTMMNEPDTAAIHNAFNSCPALPNDSLNIYLVSIDSLKAISCVNQSLCYLTIQNMGLDTVKSLDIICKFDNTNYDTITWTGNIKTYGVIQLNIPQIPYYTNGSHNLQLLTYKINSKTINIIRDTVNFRFTYRDTPLQLPFSENFSNIDFPYNNWSIENLYPLNPTFSLAQLGYCNAIKIPFYNIPSFAKSSLILPELDFSGILPCLNFEVAASADTIGDDRVVFFSSFDCGENWNYSKSLSTHVLKTAPGQLSPYTPTQSQWKAVSVNFDTLENRNNSWIMITIESQKNNNMYFRNMSISDGTGIKEFYKNNIKVYPNPAISTITIEAVDITNIEIYNITGQKVFTGNMPSPKYTIDINSFPKGIYLLKLYGKNGVGVEKIVKQ